MNFVLGPISMNVVFRVGLEATALQCNVQGYFDRLCNLLTNLYSTKILTINKPEHVGSGCETGIYN